MTPTPGFEGASGAPGSASINAGDPSVATVPAPPQSLTAQLQPDNVTIRLSVKTYPYSFYNRRGAAVLGTVRFYFTPATSADPNSISTPSAVALAFSKATMIHEISAPKFGGVSTYNADGGALGAGVFWATFVNPYSYGLLESSPVGPAFLDAAAQARLIDSVAPGDPGTYLGPTAFTIFSYPGSTLKYAKITLTFNPPDPLGSFYGISVFLNGYFSNQPGSSSYIMQGPFWRYPNRHFFDPDPFPFGDDFTFELQCDYDSTATNWLNIPHPVRIYIVSLSEAGTHLTPVTSRPSILFSNGIGA